MKIVHRIIAWLVCLLASAFGVVLLVMRLNQAKSDALSQYVLAIWPSWGTVISIAVLLCGVFGLLGFWPFYRKKVSRNIISYPGAHGSVTIQLDSVESTLSRVLSKLPEVRKIAVRVTATEDNHSARVSADVLVYKGTDAASAREITNRIGHYLHDAAVNILGSEEVTSVNLNIRGIVVDPAQANILRENANRDFAVKERDALLREEPAPRPRDESMARAREELLREEPRPNTFQAQAAAPEKDWMASDKDWAAPEKDWAATEKDFELEEPEEDAHDVAVSTEARVIGASDTSFGALLDDEAPASGSTQEKKPFQEEAERDA